MVHLVNTPASLQTTTAMRKQLQLIYTTPIKNLVLRIFLDIGDIYYSDKYSLILLHYITEKHETHLVTIMAI